MVNTQNPSNSGQFTAAHYVEITVCLKWVFFSCVLCVLGQTV